MATAAAASAARDSAVDEKRHHDASEDSATEMNLDDQPAVTGIAGITKPEPTTYADSAPPTTVPGVDPSTNIVFWDGDDDPHNPYNWPRWVKVYNCVLISALTFVTPLASCMYSSFLYNTPLRSVANATISHVRPRRPQTHARVPLRQLRARRLLRLRLHSRLRRGAHALCAAV